MVDKLQIKVYLFTETCFSSIANIPPALCFRFTAISWFLQPFGAKHCSTVYHQTHWHIETDGLFYINMLSIKMNVVLDFSLLTVCLL